MATVTLHKQLFTCYQKDGVDNHTYHHEFLSHIETIKTYGGLGAVGVIPTFLNAVLKDIERNGVISNAKNPSDAKQAQAIKAIHDEYLGALMLSGSKTETSLVPFKWTSRTNLVWGRIATPSLFINAFLF
jgi:hypothetical protein